MKKIYPAIFHKENNSYWVEFPDLEGCITQGATLEEAFAMAKEALALYLDGMKELPKATEMKAISVQNGDTVMLVEADNADDIVYIKTSEVPKYIENGLEEKGLTKGQVAFILDVDRSYLTHIVKGERVPSVDMAKRIGILLGFDWRIFYANSEGI
jgi:predicted RNase H-like HicB family nuclease/DNA-binding XRE family transcriptional regulator